MHRKLTADQIFNGYEMLPQDSVLIIDKEGVIIDISTLENSGDEIENYTGIITPGFINCHCHLELSHLKDKIPSKTGLIDFLKNIINHRNEENEHIINSIEANEKMMIANGIVAVGDICNTKHTIQQKRVNNLYYHNFIEVAGFPSEIAEARFEGIQKVHADFVNNGLIASIVPHAPYSVSTPLLEKIVYFNGNEVMTMHNQETLAENEWYENGTGQFQQFYKDLTISTSSFLPKQVSSLQYFLPYFKNNKPLILVHNVFTSENDIQFSKSLFNQHDDKLYFCLCPKANLYISNRLPDIDMLRQYKVNIVLGTDSLASNDTLCIFEEIKTISKNFPSLELTEMLRWATINGAKALKIDDLFGSFEIGKKPGVVLIEDNNIRKLD